MRLVLLLALLLQGCSTMQPSAGHVCGNVDCCDWEQREDGRWVRSAGEPWTDEWEEAGR